MVFRFFKILGEVHDDRIWAFNNNDGIGSTFVFSCPDEKPESELTDLLSFKFLKMRFELRGLLEETILWQELRIGI